ncbi:MAG: T9SS type A sorting domain-containing protein [Bacteroidales bacterium]|nr:T9SS type A sorting domain-containing protein [Bacteroidales bacterium]
MSNTIIAQQVTIGNQKTIGGSNVDEGVSIKKLNNGYVTVIRSSSNVSFDRTEARKGYMDYWLVGLNNDLTIAWQKSFGGSMMDEVYDMIVTPNNDIIIVGVSDSPISNDKTVANYGSNDVWVVCTDSVGNIKWQNVYGGTYNENFAAKIIKLNNSNYAIGTSSGSNISGNKTEDCRGSYDYWVFSIDSLGNKLWDKTFGGSSWDKFSDLVQVSDEEIIVLGTSSSPVSGEKTEGKINDDPNHLSFEGQDLWIIKYNFLTNTVLWDKTLGGMDEEYLLVKVAFDGDYIYCLSSTLSGISGTKTVSSFGALDLWLNKMDTAGNVVLQKVYGGSGGDIGSSIIVDDKNNLLIGASSGSPISGNKTEASISSDYWFLNIKTDGSIIWDKTIAGNKNENLGDVLYNGGNNFIAIGGSNSDISGDKTENARNNNGDDYTDAWIIELSSNVGINTSITNYKNIDIYPNPSADAIIIKNKNNIIETIHLYNIQGKEVITKSVQQKEYKLDVSGLSAGVYIVQGIMQNGEVFRAKFIKK